MVVICLNSAENNILLLKTRSGELECSMIGMGWKMEIQR